MDLYPLETRQSYSADVSYTLEEIAASVRQIAKVRLPGRVRSSLALYTARRGFGSDREDVFGANPTN